jgi:hypothetical protein
MGAFDDERATAARTDVVDEAEAPKRAEPGDGSAGGKVEVPPRARQLPGRVGGERQQCLGIQSELMPTGPEDRLHQWLYAAERGGRPRSRAVGGVCQSTPAWSKSRSR